MLRSRGQCPSPAVRDSPASPCGQQQEAQLFLPPFHQPRGGGVSWHWWGRGPQDGGALVNTAPPCSPWALLGSAQTPPPPQTRAMQEGLAAPRLHRSPGQHSPHSAALGSQVQDGGWAALGPLQSQGPLMWVQAQAPAQGFSFERKNEGAQEGPAVPGSTVGSGNWSWRWGRGRQREAQRQGGRFLLTLVFFLSGKKKKKNTGKERKSEKAFYPHV